MTILVYVLWLLLLDLLYTFKRNNDIKNFLLNELIECKTDEDFRKINIALENYGKMVFIYQFRKLTMENFLK